VTGLTRRTLLRRSLISAAAGRWLAAPGAALGQQVPPWPSGLPPALVGGGKVYPNLLPSAQQLYADVKGMVDLGPRFTGTRAHDAWIDWIEQGLVQAGCQMLPRDHFGFTRWLAKRWGLEILDGTATRRVPVAAYAAYSGQTPPGGVTGEPAYVGTLPELGLPGNTQDVVSMQASLERAARVAADWAKAALAGIPGGAAGRIALQGDPGTDEVLIVHTHTDGMNAFEENGGMGLVALARYFASLPPRARLKRTVVFSAVMGHFSPVAATAQTTGFVQQHPDLIKRAVASLTLEHFGCSEWIDDARGYHPTGGPKALAIWHSQTPIAVPLVDSIVAHDLRHTSALRPAGGYMIAVGGPDYLVSWADGGHLEKFLPHRAQRELQWAAGFLTRLDGMPARQLSAGDSAGLGLTQGTPLAGNPYL
jgi:hypothetical protein